MEIAQSSAVRFAQAAQPCQSAQPPCFAGLRLSELRWRWCSTEGSCITLRSCLAVANATLALARAQHDLHSYQAAQPSTAEVRSPPPSDPMLRYAQHCGVARSAQHATRQYEHAHQCHHDFSATSSAPTVRLDAFLCDPMVPNDSCPQPKMRTSTAQQLAQRSPQRHCRAHYHRQCLRCARRACHLGSTATSYVRRVIAPL